MLSLQKGLSARRLQLLRLLHDPLLSKRGNILKKALISVSSSRQHQSFHLLPFTFTKQVYPRGTYPREPAQRGNPSTSVWI